MEDEELSTGVYRQANDRLTVMAPEKRCLDRVGMKGFDDQFVVRDAALLCLANQVLYPPEEVAVVNFYRFEGISDPDDMSIIYVIETRDGRKGTLTDAYGIYADESTGEFISKTNSFNKKTMRGWC